MLGCLLSTHASLRLSMGVHVCMLSCFSRVQLFATPWTVACQAPLSMGFSRQEYWSGLSCPTPGDLPDPRIELASLKSLTGGFFTTSATWIRHRDNEYEDVINPGSGRARDLLLIERVGGSISFLCDL